MANNTSSKKIIFFVIVLAILIYYTYNYYINNNYQITIIYPDKEIIKIKPQESGGIIIPNANNIIYENLQLGKKFNKQIILQNEPEKPLNIISKKTQNDEVTDVIDEILANIVENDKKKIIEFQLDQYKDNNMLTNIVEFEQKEQEQFKKKKLSSGYLSLNKDNKGLNIVKITKDTNEINHKGLMNSNNHYKIQLASVKSILEANKERERIRKKYEKILNNLTVTVKKIEYDKGKFFYLLLAGNYNNLSQAQSVCKKLHIYQQDCIVNKYNKD